MPPPSLLDEILRIVARRYRLPAMEAASLESQEASSSTKLAIAIELARFALERGEVPSEALKRHFIEALADMIREAMREERGDPVLQAMVLRHRASQVREYASLSAHAEQDRRAVHATVNAMAHPAKQQRIVAGAQREALAELHKFASTGSWSRISETARRLLDMPHVTNDLPVQRGLAQLLDNKALRHLQRLDDLASDELVLQYQSLWDRHGPRSGSHAAAAQGAASKQRGAAVEALAAQALEALARRLNETEGDGAPYRVVTSMRVPASMPGSSDRAKSEWDVVLLRPAKIANEQAIWDVRLLVEAKASIDAATTDLPRLLRGLRLLAQAGENVFYSFETQQGAVHLRGASLRALTSDETDLTKAILYCCDAPAETAPRLLSAASRMQLLSASASLEYAGALAKKEHAGLQVLDRVWRQLLESHGWSAVLNQYPMLRQVRELMVNVEDLLATIDGDGK
jgi:hypothetical protein